MGLGRGRRTGPAPASESVKHPEYTLISNFIYFLILKLENLVINHFRVSSILGLTKFVTINVWNAETKRKSKWHIQQISLYRK